VIVFFSRPVKEEI